MDETNGYTKRRVIPDISSALYCRARDRAEAKA